MEIPEIVKEHPVPFAIGAVILILLVMRGGSSGATSSGSANNAAIALQSQQIGASSNAQIAAINSQTAIAAGDQSVELFKISQAAAESRTQTVASLFSNIAGLATSERINDSDNSLKTTLAAIMRADNNQLYKTNLDAAKTAINADVTKTLAGIDGQIKALDMGYKYSTVMSPAAQAYNLEMLKASGDNAVRLSQSENSARNRLAEAQVRQTDVNSANSIFDRVVSVFKF